MRKIFPTLLVLIGLCNVHAQTSSSTNIDAIRIDTLRHKGNSNVWFYVSTGIVYTNHIADSTFDYLNKNFTNEVHIKKLGNHSGTDDLYSITIRTNCYYKAVAILEKLIQDRYGSEFARIVAVYEQYGIKIEDAKEYTEKRCKQGGQ